jgi:hypothetical protein
MIHLMSHHDRILRVRVGVKSCNDAVSEGHTDLTDVLDHLRVCLLDLQRTGIFVQRFPRRSESFLVEPELTNSDQQDGKA